MDQKVNVKLEIIIKIFHPKLCQAKEKHSNLNKDILKL